MKFLSSFAFAFSALAASACASDGVFIERAAQVEGIYRVDSHLLNDKACSPGGTGLQDMHAFAFAKRSNVLGTDMLQVYSCASLADCRQKAALTPFEGTIDFGFTLSDISGETLTGFEVTTGYAEGSTCTKPELSDIELTLTGGKMKIEKATQIGHSYPSDNGACTTDKGRAASEDAPCAQMETLTATFVEAL
ncbi:MAG: hypothetical protein H0T46_17755 [Deltaproteobacteria bacterium]|nr:hypothetical protein [Deltaproteobacteria bacterium]